MVKKRQLLRFLYLLLLCLNLSFRLLTESKQEEFIQRAQMLIQSKKFGEAVSL